MNIGAFAIIPTNDLDAALSFWDRLGFRKAGGDSSYVILRGWDCEIHVAQAGDGPWRVPDANPFGIFIRTPEVEKIAAQVDDLVIKPGGILRHRDWGMYEVGINGPDNLLVRIGWPSELMKAETGR
ncbi:MAG: glyoxalase [Pseudolabrys sp.]|nr:glyoxalase [Pseudolabrys sp.]